MGSSSVLKNSLLIIAVSCLLTFASTESANADGCWGSSRGGWGSGGSLGGGSYGCRGGLFSNAPVRSLLSRVGVGVGNGISLVGNGIANIFDRRPLRSALLGSRGGWGSRGSYGSTGCTGGWGGNGGWGSNGSYAPAPVAQWSQPSYISLPEATCSSCGPMLASTTSSIQSLPIVATDGFVGTSAYVDPVATQYSNSNLGDLAVNQFETSAPVLDYGVYGSQFGTIGMPTDASMINGAMVTGPMMELQSEAGGSMVSPEATDLPPYYNNDDSFEAAPEDGFGAQDDEDDSAYLQRGKAVLSLDVPENAKVFINDKLTRTEGTRRSYVSRNLAYGQEYRYRVKVVSEMDGKEVIKSRIVTMRGGESNQLAFNFDPIVTRVVVSVPDDAKVIIDGKETSTAGSFRSFSTEKLKSGKWDDYSVEVSVVRNGKTLTRKEKFDLAAGEFRFFEFDFDKAGAGSVASK